MAREARAGDMVNPFAMGWLEASNLYPAAMGWLSHLTDDTLGSFRVVMALVGAITVLATWRPGGWGGWSSDRKRLWWVPWFWL